MKLQVEMVTFDEVAENNRIYLDLEKCIEEIYRRDSMTKEQYISLYNKTYQVCVNGKGKVYGEGKKVKMLSLVLYEKISILLKNYLETLRKVRNYTNLTKFKSRIFPKDLINFYFLTILIFFSKRKT